MNRNNGFYAGYRRILLIDKLLTSGYHLSSTRIVQKIKEIDRDISISVPTLKRDISYMRTELNAPIAYSKRNEEWYYTTNTFKLPARFTTESELFASKLTKKLVTQKLSAVSAFKDAVILLNTETSPVENPYENKTPSPDDWMEDRIIVLEENSERIIDDVWNKITTAIRENREISFLHKGLGSPNYKWRTVRPYQLILAHGIWNQGHSYWNLYCYDCDKKKLRIYQLNHIKYPQLQPTHFQYNKQFDFRMKSRGVFGAFIGEQKETFKLNFYWQSADMVRGRVWGDNQKIREIEDGGVELTFDSCEYIPILRWALSCGCECYPLEPKRFVNEWRKSIADVMENEEWRNNHLGIKNDLSPIP